MGEIKQVSASWTWFADYALAYGNWTVNCPRDRTCQVGMGIKLFGTPQGEKISFSGHREFVTLGVGAIHIRCVDGRGPCKVRLDQGSVGPITIISEPI